MKRFFTVFAILSTMLCLSGCDLAKVESTNLTAKGMKLYQQGSTLSAMQAFTEALRKDPNNDQALYRLAQLEMTQKNYGDAKTHLDQCISLRPNIAQYWYMLGKAEYDEAQEYEKEATLADTRSKLYHKCTESFSKAVELDPAYAEAHLRLARCFLGNAKFEDAVIAFETSIRQNPHLKTTGKFGTAVAFKELGILYANYGFYESAEAVFMSGILANPGDVELETEFANVYQDRGKFGEAAAHFEAAYESLTSQGGATYYILPAIFGAGVAHYSIAQDFIKNGKEREGHDELAKAETWFSKFVMNASTEEVQAQKVAAAAYLEGIRKLLDKDRLEEEEV